MWSQKNQKQKTMAEYDILTREIGGVTLHDMTAITFVGFIAKKLNNIDTFNADAQALSQMVKNPPMGKMSDESKLEAVNRLERLGIIL